MPKRLYTIRDCEHAAGHRHGTAYAYRLDGCRCVPCTDAATAQRKRVRRRTDLGLQRATVHPAGTVRRLRALTAMGWSTPVLAEAMGVHADFVMRLRSEGTRQRFVFQATADRVRYTYDKLWHVTPPGRYQERCERYAARMGWAAPWQWEGVDIDDPDAKPLEPQPVKKEPPECGTMAAARRHYRLGGTPCPACVAAYRRNRASRGRGAA